MAGLGNPGHYFLDGSWKTAAPCPAAPNADRRCGKPGHCVLGGSKKQPLLGRDAPECPLVVASQRDLGLPLFGRLIKTDLKADFLADFSHRRVFRNDVADDSLDSLFSPCFHQQFQQRSP